VPGFALRRPPPRRTTISVVSMIDVMMILLFFFMVTSTYLNLDMVPALQKAEDSLTAPATTPEQGATLMIRIAADGVAMIGGQAYEPAALAALLQSRLAADPLTPIVLFPSGAAHLQDLIGVMDTVTRSGAVRVKVIRIEAAP
jgi:biopolymer transport protein ExbD